MRRQILNRGLLTVAAASSILAVTGGIASADSDAGARNTSGHSADDQAATQDDSAAGASSDAAASATGTSGASARSDAEGSPGILSGNSLSVPLDVPVNVCGNSVDVGALLDPAFGNHCANEEAPASSTAVPPRQEQTPPAPQATRVSTPEVRTQLAETGTSGHAVGAAAGVGAAMLLGGAMLYRRSTRAARVRRTYS